MFKKILIANRGEIACRVIRTARRMGIETVAVYSEADTNALHVSQADDAAFIGASPANQSYLNMHNVMDAIRRKSIDAVHPGYGFLSENAGFARALRNEGVVFIGPSVEAIESMGDKIESKKLAQAAGVSTVPGYLGVIADPKEAIKIAEQIGFPVMLKAAAGGGGKGMRIVRSAKEVEQAFSSATNEAKNSFGDSRVFIEKFIENPRHIEIQILADKHGTVLCLGERECSIQRHNQKVIEEAPSPFIDEPTRAKMYAESAALARKVGYHSAGTIEFIVDQDKNFYFLEMNTRLQVEHPVTEYITGLDLVEWMIRIAQGEKLPFKQEDIVLKGSAIECRVYAEDPTRGFLPSSGRLVTYQEPKTSPNVRVDTGVYAGGEVSQFYDAMIAKLITYGPTREEAIERMHTSLGEYIITGISHNISFLETLISHPQFKEGNISTNFIAQHWPSGFSGATLDEFSKKVVLAIGAFVFLKDARRAAQISGQAKGRPRQIATRWVVGVDDEFFPIDTHETKFGMMITHNNSQINLVTEWVLGSTLFQGVIDDRIVNAKIHYTAGGFQIDYSGASCRVTVRTPRIAELGKFMPESTLGVRATSLASPIAGKVVAIKCKVGDVVKAGGELAIIEAMKMENVIYADYDVTIKKIHAKDGDSLISGQLMIEFA